MSVNTVTVTLGKKLFSFTSHQHWVNSAQRLFAANGVRSKHVLCVDQQGRILHKGLEFSRAEKEHAFPVDVYLALVGDNELHDRFMARDPDK